MLNMRNILLALAVLFASCGGATPPPGPTHTLSSKVTATYFQTYNDTFNVIYPDDAANACWAWPNDNKPLPSLGYSYINPLQYNVLKCPTQPYIPFDLNWSYGKGDAGCNMVVTYDGLTTSLEYVYSTEEHTLYCSLTPKVNGGGLPYTLVTVTDPSAKK